MTARRDRVSARDEWIDPCFRYVIRPNIAGVPQWGNCFLWAPRGDKTGEPATYDPKKCGTLRPLPGQPKIDAHRYVYARMAERGRVPKMPCDAFGELLPEVAVWQRCGDRRCINPGHLLAGSIEVCRADRRARRAEREQADAEATGNRVRMWSATDGMLTLEQVRRIRDRSSGTLAQLSAEIGLSTAAIAACRVGKTYQRWNAEAPPITPRKRAPKAPPARPMTDEEFQLRLAEAAAKREAREAAARAERNEPTNGSNTPTDGVDATKRRE